MQVASCIKENIMRSVNERILADGGSRHGVRGGGGVKGTAQCEQHTNQDFWYVFRKQKGIHYKYS